MLGLAALSLLLPLVAPSALLLRRYSHGGDPGVSAFSFMQRQSATVVDGSGSRKRGGKAGADGEGGDGGVAVATKAKMADPLATKSVIHVKKKAKLAKKPAPKAAAVGSSAPASSAPAASSSGREEGAAEAPAPAPAPAASALSLLGGYSDSGDSD